MTDSANPFDGDRLQDSTYARADMARTRFDGVNLDGARFFAVLTNATFDDTNLAGASFDDVNLAGATLNNVNLSGARIENANLSDADIRNANYAGMRIEGVLVTELLEAHGER